MLLGYNDYANFDLSKTLATLQWQRATTGLRLDPVTEWVNTSAYTLTGSVNESVYLSVYQNKIPITLPKGGFVSGGGNFELNVNLLPGANLFEVYAKRDKSTFFDHVDTTINQDRIIPDIRIAEPPATVRDAVYTLTGALSKAASLTIKLNGERVVDSVYHSGGAFLISADFTRGE